MTISAAFQWDVGSGYQTAGVAQNAAAAATVNARVNDLTGIDTIDWEIFGTHGVADPTLTFSGSPNKQIASFTLGTLVNNPNGQAYGLRCTVTNANGDRDVAQSAVYVLGPLGKRPVFFFESTEGDANYGVVPRFNELLAGAMAADAAGAGVLYERFADQTVTGGAGATVIHTIATPTENGEYYVSAWVLARDTGSDRAVYHVGGSYKRVGGTVSAIVASEKFVEHENDATWDVAWSTDSTDIRISLTPDAANDTTADGLIMIVKRT